ncbi:M48 family metalloprotease [Pseudoalteromonas tunicata]|jgi:predicted Zn-dependent protease|uniref:Putative beta-barrel assembly-enhancing protease n=1 Tax=Pseudoalteromonas tunicata D2 TaxID=87626 RepID=A4CBB7_9GAMM|nr:M48 family metalloprotease [Pseudoalteromonas tunicata]ATC94209.1 hypothetical protein PTUN_a1600 [Pseudoalteromonas tunicata]AXT29969.1 M48 family peptidase [Pseudoalteromonas tunicata]EAR27654.1 putative prenylyltransferase domain and metalloprotease (zincins), catalytic domain [Pseudoalteromonas tunicata D2]MDP4983035.1 M48 family metalloprotease [Pseudoalteromonas tunicata]MDP5211437.1 M48 family metalloprotease [Pseudoalteromonas tunicata]
MNKKTRLAVVLSSYLAFSPYVTAQTSFNLPDLGTSAVSALSIDKEQAVGELMMMKVKSASPVFDDPVLDEYLTNIGNKLVANANDVRFPFKFFWLRNSDINAFAFYGGHVGVHTGLILNADDENQFASVLGHEIAHVTQRHLARRIQAQQENAPLSIAGMIAGILATIVAPDAGMAIISANQTQSALSQMSHSRGAEQEADRIGMTIMNNAGFDPRSSSEFLGKLSAQLRFKQKPPVFLLTHPLPDSRVSDVRLRAEQFPVKHVPSSLDFLLAKSRVIARFADKTENAELFFRSELKKSISIDKRALQYGLALALVDLKQFEEAQTLLSDLLADDSNNPFYLDTKTDLLLAQDKAAEAVKMLIPHHEVKPNNQVITLNLANAAMSAKQLDEAESLLKNFLLEKPNHSLAKQLLADCYKRQEKKAAYHETLASIMASNGGYQQASDEIQKALNFVESNEDIKQQRLKALLKQYRQMQKDLARL